MQLNEEQVLALAPDDASRKSGKELSNPAKWVTKGGNEMALWGECQGSGSKPYQTQVDLSGMAFKCSCPSRKFPCKHGIGLLLLYARQSNSFQESEAPAWVTDWLNKRTEKEEKKTEKKDKPVDEAAQAKRLQVREKTVEDGMTELLRWIKDIIRNGIIGIPEKEPAFFYNMSRRMIDAKAPGLAALVKTAGNINFYKEGWQSEFMDILVRMYLLITGFTHKQNLPPDLLEDLRNNIGFTQSQEALKEMPGISDTWLVVGKQTTTEDNLTIERNWLYGATSNSVALILQFSVMGQGMALNLMPGIALTAELVFFPSAQPLRAIIKSHTIAAKLPSLNGFTAWQQVAEAETGFHAAMPWSVERPYLVKQLTPVSYEGHWWLADNDNNLVQVKENYKAIYELLAISGGQPLDMVVLGKETAWEPLGVWSGNRYIFLSN